MDYHELGNWCVHSLAALCHREESASHHHILLIFLSGSTTTICNHSRVLIMTLKCNVNGVK